MIYLQSNCHPGLQLPIHFQVADFSACAALVLPFVNFLRFGGANVGRYLRFAYQLLLYGCTQPRTNFEIRYYAGNQDPSSEFSAKAW